MPDRKDSDLIAFDHHADGIDRRGFLKCMAWAGTGLVCTFSGGLFSSQSFAQALAPRGNGLPGGRDFHFAQISDSHIGFSKDANKDVVGTLQAAVDRLNALPSPPDFVIHTGDISHLSKPDEFDTVDQMLKTVKTGRVYYVPGEHDVLNDDGKQYLARYGKDTHGEGWFSFDHKGVHFIGLVNVLDLKAGGLGQLGQDQLAWLKGDVKALESSTPIVVFAHIPLWSVYPEWGWGTDDGAQALASLKRFGSVTVLNGHIHQTMKKVEGNVTFHTAMSTAFPQPKPGTAHGPGPMKVPDDQLRSLLGVTEIDYVRGRHSLAIVDSALQNSGAAPGADRVSIDNFRFTPEEVTVATGAQVTWTNHDDVPHTVVSTDKAFTSPALDTNDEFTHAFPTPGRFGYYCSMHPRMTGVVIVR